MDDLISRQAAIMAVLYGSLGATTIYGRTEHGMTAQKETVQAIRMLPSADAVEVVRCKDCRLSEPGIDITEYWCCYWDNKTLENGYCSHGKRKYGEQNDIR